MNAEKFLDLLPLSRYTTQMHMALFAFPPSNRGNLRHSLPQLHDMGNLQLCN